MHIGKRLFSIVPVVLCLVILVQLGLSGTVVEGENEQEENSFLDRKDTLYFWYSDEELTDYINRVAVEFGEVENIRILPVLVSDSHYLESINLASIAEEQPVPDLYCISNEALEKAYLAGLATEIQDKGSNIVDTFFPTVAQLAVTYQNKYIAYPFYYETSALLYNKDYVSDWQQQQEESLAEEDTQNDLVDENSEAQILYEEYLELVAHGIPETMKEILSFADYYRAPDTVQGIFKWDVTDIFYNYHFAGDGLNVGGAAGDDETHVQINNEQVKLGLLEYQKSSDFFYIETENIDSITVLEEFMAGEMVFTLATSDAIQVLEQGKEDGTFIYDYGISQLPKVESSSRANGLSVTSSIVINGYSVKKDLANEFALYLVNNYSEYLYDRTGKLSASYNGQGENEILKLFMDVYEQSASLPKLYTTSNYWIQLEVMFAKIWNGEDIEQQLVELEEQIRYQIKGIN